jgi:hypothetical protein
MPHDKADAALVHVYPEYHERVTWPVWPTRDWFSEGQVQPRPVLFNGGDWP